MKQVPIRRAIERVPGGLMVVPLGKVWLAGLLGLGLGVAVVVVTGLPLFFADRLTGGSGVAGVAAASTAGNAVAVPAIIASAPIPRIKMRPRRRRFWWRPASS